MKKLRSFQSFDGEALFYTVTANSPSPIRTAVLLHGIGADSEAYHTIQTLMLSHIPHMQIIACDLRGHGLSSRIFPPSEPELLVVLAKDLRSLCMQEKVIKPILIGQSIGGMIIQEYLRLPFHQPPSKIFIISSTPSTPGFLPFSLEQRYQTFATFIHQNQPLTMSQKRAWGDHLKHKNSLDMDARRFIADVKSVGLLPYALLWIAAAGWKNTDMQMLNQNFVYYIYGKYDRLFPESMQQKIAKNLDKAHVYQIDTNHNSIVNAPEAIAQIICESFGVTICMDDSSTHDDVASTKYHKVVKKYRQLKQNFHLPRIFDSTLGK